MLRMCGLKTSQTVPSPLSPLVQGHGKFERAKSERKVKDLRCFPSVHEGVDTRREETSPPAHVKAV